MFHKIRILAEELSNIILESFLSNVNIHNSNVDLDTVKSCTNFCKHFTWCYVIVTVTYQKKNCHQSSALPPSVGWALTFSTLYRQQPQIGHVAVASE